MGKWNPKKVKRRIAEGERENELRIKESLRSKKLLKIIRSGGILKDAVLLFGNHKGERILDLLGGFDTSPYVLNYLAQNKMIPKKTRKIICELIESYDPFDSINSVTSRSTPILTTIGEVVYDDDEIPW